VEVALNIPETVAAFELLDADTLKLLTPVCYNSFQVAGS
jgi:hypothetical protein